MGESRGTEVAYRSEVLGGRWGWFPPGRRTLPTLLFQVPLPHQT